jgi:hypothetical protein
MVSILAVLRRDGDWGNKTFKWDMIVALTRSVPDPHTLMRTRFHFHEDPYPTFSMLIRIFIRLIKICNTACRPSTAPG